MAETRFKRREVLNAISDDLGWMPHSDRLVFLVLFRHADKTGKVSPGQSRIAAALGLHRSHVSRLLARLVRWGLINVVRRGHRGDKKPTAYEIRPPSEWPTKSPLAEDC